METIYFDNAATTLRKPQCVIDAVCKAMQTSGNPSRGAHESSLAANRIVYDARVKIAHFFNCSRPDHVVFTSNSTEALNVAINGILDNGDHVITTALEHNSVLRPLYRLETDGKIFLDIVSANKNGCIDYDDFAMLMRPNTKAIVCTHASNLTGNALDIEKIGSIAKKNNVLLVVDASQSAGVLPIDMEKMHIDILCFTGHKGLYGPQGTGGLCIREGVNVKPLKVGGTGVKSYSHFQPKELPTCLEAGTLNSHGIAGLSAALDFINEVGIESFKQKELSFAKRFVDGLQNIDGITIYGDFSDWKSDRTAIVTINIRNYDSATVADELEEEYGISTRSGAHCAPLMHSALGTIEQGAVRFSFSWFNTEEEVDAAIRAVKKIAE